MTTCSLCGLIGPDHTDARGCLLQYAAIVADLTEQLRIVSRINETLSLACKSACADADEAELVGYGKGFVGGRAIARGLVEHVLAVADDVYLGGHPEWDCIVADAQRVQP